MNNQTRPVDRDLISKALSYVYNNGGDWWKGLINTSNNVANTMGTATEYGAAALGANILSGLAALGGNKQLSDDLEHKRQVYNKIAAKKLPEIWSKDLTRPIEESPLESGFNLVTNVASVVPGVSTVKAGIKSGIKAADKGIDLLNANRKVAKAVKHADDVLVDAANNPAIKKAGEAVVEAEDAFSKVAKQRELLEQAKDSSKTISKKAKELGAPSAITNAINKGDIQADNIRTLLNSTYDDYMKKRHIAKVLEDAAKRSDDYYKEVYQRALGNIDSKKTTADIKRKIFNSSVRNFGSDLVDSAAGLGASVAVPTSVNSAINKISDSMHEDSLPPEAIKDLNNKLGFIPTNAPTVEDALVSKAFEQYMSQGANPSESSKMALEMLGYKSPYDNMGKLYNEELGAILQGLSANNEQDLINPLASILAQDSNAGTNEIFYNPEEEYVPQQVVQQVKQVAPTTESQAVVPNVVQQAVPEAPNVQADLVEAAQVKGITQDYIHQLMQSNVPQIKALGVLLQQQQDMLTRQKELAPLLQRQEELRTQLRKEAMYNPLFWLGNLIAAPFKLRYRGMSPIQGWEEDLNAVVDSDPNYSRVMEQIGDIRRSSPTAMDLQNSMSDLIMKQALLGTESQKLGYDATKTNVGVGTTNAQLQQQADTSNRDAKLKAQIANTNAVTQAQTNVISLYKRMEENILKQQELAIKIANAQSTAEKNRIAAEKLKLEKESQTYKKELYESQTALNKAQADYVKAGGDLRNIQTVQEQTKQKVLDQATKAF